MTEERTTRALLVVSFGTSVVQAGKKTIDRIEEELGSVAAYKEPFNKI